MRKCVCNLKHILWRRSHCQPPKPVAADMRRRVLQPLARSSAATPLERTKKNHDKLAKPRNSSPGSTMSMSAAIWSPALIWRLAALLLVASLSVAAGLGAPSTLIWVRPGVSGCKCCKNDDGACATCCCRPQTPSNNPASPGSVCWRLPTEIYMLSVPSSGPYRVLVFPPPNFCSAPALTSAEAVPLFQRNCSLLL